MSTVDPGLPPVALPQRRDTRARRAAAGWGHWLFVLPFLAVYIVLLTGGLVIGAAVGGPLSHRFGLTAPYWFGFGCAGLVLVAIWPQLRHLTYEAPERMAAS